MQTQTAMENNNANTTNPTDEQIAFVLRCLLLGLRSNTAEVSEIKRRLQSQPSAEEIVRRALVTSPPRHQ